MVPSCLSDIVGWCGLVVAAFRRALYSKVGVAWSWKVLEWPTQREYTVTCASIKNKGLGTALFYCRDYLPICWWFVPTLTTIFSEMAS